MWLFPFIKIHKPAGAAGNAYLPRRQAYFVFLYQKQSQTIKSSEKIGKKIYKTHLRCFVD
ncbi:hypothetical protein DWX08_11295 [Ruminococcus sp. AF18-22]|jgi:hypothetical protein|nr:hypothetical protein DWX08_11295 [Ruminococcus sp. AF18-22]